MEEESIVGYLHTRWPVMHESVIFLQKVLLGQMQRSQVSLFVQSCHGWLTAESNLTRQGKESPEMWCFKCEKCFWSQLTKLPYKQSPSWSFKEKTRLYTPSSPVFYLEFNFLAYGSQYKGVFITFFWRRVSERMDRLHCSESFA